MEKQIKTIGVLTSGGDAPGMNAAVRAVVRTGLHKGYRMIGIQRGYNGLLNGECFEMNLRSVSNIISAGGTILYTARCLEFKTKEGQDRGAAKCRELGIDALVVIGGDGSYRGARELAHRGIPMIGLPGTIDNDIACTDYTIGYDTAMNTALEMIDKLRDTTQSHDRCSVVEVMGRNAGYIALNVAIASGAMAVLLPEKEFDMQHDILDKIVERMNQMDYERAEEYEMPETEPDGFAEAYMHTPVGKIYAYSMAQFDHWTKEKFPSNFRKMLTLEQYRDEKLARLYHDYLATGPAEYMAAIFRKLTDSDENARSAPGWSFRPRSAA
mgnify:CR=1 FL=1